MKQKTVMERYAKQYQIPFLGRDLSDVNAVLVLGDRPLHYAVLNRSVEDAKTLVSEGADVNLRGDLGRTPVFFAVYKTCEELVSYFISIEADPRIVDNYGMSAIDEAKRQNREDILKILLSGRQP
jgi:ankyrin repeat protein